jgi:hypothetical protein
MKPLATITKGSLTASVAIGGGEPGGSRDVEHGGCEHIAARTSHSCRFDVETATLSEPGTEDEDPNGRRKPIRKLFFPLQWSLWMAGAV